MTNCILYAWEVSFTTSSFVGLFCCTEPGRLSKDATGAVSLPMVMVWFAWSICVAFALSMNDILEEFVFGMSWLSEIPLIFENLDGFRGGRFVVVLAV